MKTWPTHFLECRVCGTNCLLDDDGAAWRDKDCSRCGHRYTIGLTAHGIQLAREHSRQLWKDAEDRAPRPGPGIVCGLYPR